MGVTHEYLPFHAFIKNAFAHLDLLMPPRYTYHHGIHKRVKGNPLSVVFLITEFSECLDHLENQLEQNAAALFHKMTSTHNISETALQGIIEQIRHMLSQPLVRSSVQRILNQHDNMLVNEWVRRMSSLNSPLLEDHCQLRVRTHTFNKNNFLLWCLLSLY